MSAITTLISWKAIDSHGIASIYIASDSRFSWKTDYWDYGKKLYGSNKFSEMIGYCGDVLLAVSIISSLIHIIDKEIIYKNLEAPDIKNKKVVAFIEKRFLEYPKTTDTTLIHVIKDNHNYYSYYEISYSIKAKSWISKKISLESSGTSSLIGVYGSGAKSYNEKKIEYEKSDSNGTSRHYYMTLCDTIASKKDNRTGGPPQLMSIYRGKESSIDIGVLWNGKRFIHGLEILDEFYIDSLEWRNENFERYMARENKIIKGAQRQPRSQKMKKPPK